MQNYINLEPVDYLLIGHITKDITPGGYSLGGTATYSAMTAAALGLRVGIVTSFGPDLDLPDRPRIQVANLPSESTTTFRNTYTPAGRIQHVYSRAVTLELSAVPEVWRDTPIVHLGPIMQEVDPKLAHAFPNALVGLTPQGWMRSVNSSGLVHYTDWPEARYVLEGAQAAVFSIEDVQGNEAVIEDLIPSIRVMVVTEGASGARLYWNGDLRTFKPPQVEEIDPVGAGDIFAAAFFIRMHQTRDPWEAARFATQLAATSVTRPGVLGVPTEDEVKASLITILP
jgi:sugar/nucleoside kinase (ribokinase family)